MKIFGALYLEYCGQMFRYCSHLSGMGGKVLFRCDVLCKWAGILEEGTAYLPTVFFRAVIKRRNYKNEVLRKRRKVC